MMQNSWGRFAKWALFTTVYWVEEEKSRLFSSVEKWAVTLPTVPQYPVIKLLTMLCLIQRVTAEDFTLNLQSGIAVGHSIDLTQMFGRMDIANAMFNFPPELTQSGLKLYPRWIQSYVPGSIPEPYHLIANNREQVEVFSQGIQLLGESLKTTFFSAGQVKWSYQTGDMVRSSPTIGSDGAVYFGSDDKYLYVLNRNGTFRWRYPMAGAVTCSPALGSDGTVYIGSEGDASLFALNRDGSFRWRYPIGANTSFSSPALGSDGSIYVGSGDGYLYALTATGDFRWRAPIGRTSSSPAIGSDGTVYVGSMDNNLYAVNPNGNERWRYPTTAPIHSSPAIGSDGTVYVASMDGYLYAVYLDGSRRWQYQTQGEINSSPAIDSDGTVYIGSRDKSLYALDRDGQLQWSYQTAGFIVSSPAIGRDGTVYVGSFDSYLPVESADNYFYALNKKGEVRVRWNYQTNSRIQSSPAISGDGTVYVGTRSTHSLYAFSIKEFVNTSSWSQFRQNKEHTASYSSEALQLFDLRYLTLEGIATGAGRFKVDVLLDQRQAYHLWIDIKARSLSPSFTLTPGPSFTLIPNLGANATSNSTANRNLDELLSALTVALPIIGGSLGSLLVILIAIKCWGKAAKCCKKNRAQQQQPTAPAMSELFPSNLSSLPQGKPDDRAIPFGLSIILYAKLGDKGKKLGEGAYGIVTQSTWQHIDVAVKELKINQLSDASTAEFQREANRHAAFNHPNIVRLYGLCIEPGRYCMVMELMVMGSLYQVLRNLQPLPWGTRLDIAKGIAIGLSYLHQQDPSILHCDLKSLNVLLDINMQAKLADFGLSKIKEEAAVASGTMHHGMVAGTLQWMAPELLEGQRPTESSDIYALGMLFWELASRQSPFAGMLHQFVIKEHVTSGKREEIPADTPPSFARLISRCWAQRTSDRPRLVSEVVEELGVSAGEAQSASGAASGYQFVSH